MFELLEETRGASKPPMSRRVAVLGVLIGGFWMGLVSGKLLAGAKPFDWTLQIMDLIFAISLTTWCVVVVARRDTADNN
jgi:hypothetical protein